MLSVVMLSIAVPNCLAKCVYTVWIVMLSVTVVSFMLTVFMLSDITMSLSQCRVSLYWVTLLWVYRNAECHYTECHAKYRYAECHYTECRGSTLSIKRVSDREKYFNNLFHCLLGPVLWRYFKHCSSVS